MDWRRLTRFRPCKAHTFLLLVIILNEICSIALAVDENRLLQAATFRDHLHKYRSSKPSSPDDAAAHYAAAIANWTKAAANSSMLLGHTKLLPDRPAPAPDNQLRNKSDRPDGPSIDPLRYLDSPAWPEGFTTPRKYAVLPSSGLGPWDAEVFAEAWLVFNTIVSFMSELYTTAMQWISQVMAFWHSGGQQQYERLQEVQNQVRTLANSAPGSSDKFNKADMNFQQAAEVSICRRLHVRAGCQHVLDIVACRSRLLNSRQPAQCTLPMVTCCQQLSSHCPSCRWARSCITPLQQLAHNVRWSTLHQQHTHFGLSQVSSLTAAAVLEGAEAAVIVQTVVAADGEWQAQQHQL